MSKFCNHCGTMLGDDEKFCPNCGAKVETEVVKEAATVVNNTETVTNQSTLNNNINQGAQKTNGMAIAAMVCGIVGVFFGHLLLGVTALCLAIAARNRLKIFPEEKGKGMATAGLVLGIVDIGIWLVAVLVSLATVSTYYSLF